MNLIKTLTIFLFLFAASNTGFGQEIIEDENWLREIGGDYTRGSPFITYQFKTFNKEDVAKAKQKLKSLQKSIAKNEWEGIYYANTVIGDEKLIWNSESGFFQFYFYHELRNLNYGSINNSPSFIQLVSEKSLISNSDKKQFAKAKLIKVKFGEKHFLVYENRLQDFIDRSAGLTTNLGDFYYYWTKEEDMEKKIFGFPILPSEYKHLLRHPVEAKIISIEKKKIVPNKQSTKEYNFNDIHYPVTLNAGRNKNIKIGMNFFVEDLGEWIQATKVLQRSFTGLIKRDFDENNKEQCRDGENGSGQLIPCKEIKTGMRARTKTDL